MREIIDSFVTEIKSKTIEIYNEFSLQHELGFFLRNKIDNKMVQFERNVTYFRLIKAEFIKKEIDISVFHDRENPGENPDFAIELKYPRNGQVPEQMFSFCKDICFAEQLQQRCFKTTYVIIFVEDRLFYEGNNCDGIYAYFRAGTNLHGSIQKPTGQQKGVIEIQGNYNITWVEIMGSLKYTIIEINDG